MKIVTAMLALFDKFNSILVISNLIHSPTFCQRLDNGLKVDNRFKTLYLCDMNFYKWFLLILAGWFIYIETSYPSQENNTARLVSPEIPSTAQMCFQFWYHMFGSNVANLTVARMQGTIRKDLWTKSGTQGDRWRHATLDVASSTKFKVKICIGPLTERN